MSTWTPPVAGAVDGAGALDTGLDLKHGNRADGLIIFLGSPLRQILAVALVIHHAHPAQARNRASQTQSEETRKFASPVMSRG